MPESEVEKTIAQLRKKFGEFVIRTASEAPAHVEIISTGSLKLDRALGIGGVPRGLITELFGLEAAGKTTLAQHLIAEAQKAGGLALFMDLEHKADPTYMAACGVDMEKLLVSQPLAGGEAFDVIKAMIGEADLIVVDSVAALASAAELDADSSDQFVGVQARMMSQNLKAIIGKLGLSKTALVFINQVREKIGMMWGSPETTPGGRALKFYACVRMRVSQAGHLGSKGKEYGIKSRVKVVKNCRATPWKETEIGIVWGKGIDQVADVLDVAVATGVMEGTAGYYKFESEQIGHGREMAKNYLREHPDLVARVRELVLQQKDAPATSAAEGDGGESEPDMV